MTSGPRPRSCVILIKPVNRTNPVFVVGSPRSGTTLLYHTLLSSGCFAVYRAETEIFSTIAFRFDFSSPVGLQRLLDVWILSDLFQLSGLDAGRFRDRIMLECRNSGDFLRIFMESIARQQHVERWAEKTPDHLLYAAEIKKTIPDALFIHIIRDGRDVAASMGVLGYIPVLPWDKSREVLAAGLYWEWLLRQGRKYRIHCWLATQRVARMNVSALQQLHSYFVSTLPRFYDRMVISESFALPLEVLERTAQLDTGEWIFVSYKATKRKNVPVFLRTEDNEKAIANYLKDR